MGWFRAFSPKPTTPACAAQCTTPPPPPPRQHHPTIPPIDHHRCFRWHAPNRALVGLFWAFSPKPTTWLVQPNARPCHRRHLVHTSPPPLLIAHYRCFQRRAPNQALVGWFLVFGPNPLPEPCVSNRTATPPPQQQQHHPTTPLHHLPLPFHTACPKLSHNSSVSCF